FVFSPGLMIQIFKIYPLCFDRFLTFGFYFEGEIVFIYSFVTLIDGNLVGENSWSIMPFFLSQAFQI
ncbi:MAG: hypothetical protein ACK559_08620, partial [bacterium]